MKPNGKRFAVRGVFFVMCAVASLVVMGNAETVRGTFKLPMEAHWGALLLAPGDYEFTVGTESNSRIVTVRSMESGWSGMVMSEGFSSVSSMLQPALELDKTNGSVYVRELRLVDLGIVLDFAAPRPGKTMALVKSKIPTNVSASGLQ